MRAVWSRLAAHSPTAADSNGVSNSSPANGERQRPATAHNPRAIRANFRICPA